MLGRTAGGLFWMFRYLERSENIARLLEAGFRISLTRAETTVSEWQSVLTSSGNLAAYNAQHDDYSPRHVINFLLRDWQNPNSILSNLKSARDNARTVRTALTREVWEAMNEAWLTMNTLLSKPVTETQLPDLLSAIRQQNALVRGAAHGTQLRNDGFNFTRLGTFVERADSTARILDVKYYLLLPNLAQVGSSLDMKQWEMILRSVSAQRAFQWINGPEISASKVAEFLILNRQMPRSLAFCNAKIADNLGYLVDEYGEISESHKLAIAQHNKIQNCNVISIFDNGLHEFLLAFLQDNANLSNQIEKDYRFVE